MNFRIIEIRGYQVLLERIQDDDQWVVITSVYIDVVNRYDEWVPCDTVLATRACILAYTEDQAGLFIDRAHIWYQQEHQRRHRQIPTSAS